MCGSSHAEAPVPKGRYQTDTEAVSTGCFFISDTKKQVINLVGHTLFCKCEYMRDLLVSWGSLHQMKIPINKQTVPKCQAKSCFSISESFCLPVCFSTADNTSGFYLCDHRFTNHTRHNHMVLRLIILAYSQYSNRNWWNHLPFKCTNPETCKKNAFI